MRRNCIYLMFASVFIILGGCESPPQSTNTNRQVAQPPKHTASTVNGPSVLEAERGDPPVAEADKSREVPIQLTPGERAILSLEANEKRFIDMPIGKYLLTVSTQSTNPVLIAVSHLILGAKKGDNIDLVVERKNGKSTPVILSCKHGSVYGFYVPGLGQPEPPRAVLVNSSDDKTPDFTVILHVFKEEGL